MPPLGGLRAFLLLKLTTLLLLVAVVERTITQVAAVQAVIGRAQHLLTQRFLIQSLLVLEAWGELLLAVVALQMVQILSFLQSHLLEAVKVARVVVFPQVLLEVPVEAQAAIQVPLVALATHLQLHHLKVTMAGQGREQLYYQAAAVAVLVLLVAMVPVQREETVVLAQHLL